MRRPLLVTPGDPQGVGPEICGKALRARTLDALVVGDPCVQEWLPELPVVDRVQAVEGLALLVPPPGAEPVEVRALRIAAAACQAGEGRALVTGPIHKGRLAARGFAYKGHTDFLGALCGVERPVMAFTGGSIRVALVTVHVALSAVPALLSAERVVHTGRLAAQALRDQLGIQEPRLLVCGLNPHAGDDGLMGDEEARIIAPACAQLRAEGWRAEGPLSPEGAFRLAQEGRGDLVLAMYHDQGLLPLKVLDAGRSVNWTLGLPFVRTSVDHGTADDIAGQDRADPSSMVAALELALELTRTSA